MARWLIFPLFISEIKSIYRLLKDKAAKKRYKAIIILGLVYLFSPIDLIPAPIIGLSIIDDCVIWAVILYALKEPLSHYKDGDPVGKKSKMRAKGKNIYETEDYVVVEENDNKENRNDGN